MCLTGGKRAQDHFRRGHLFKDACWQKKLGLTSLSCPLTATPRDGMGVNLGRACFPKGGQALFVGRGFPSGK